MAGAMLKGDPLLAEPNTVTTTFPVVAAAGTVTTMLVALQLVTAAAAPLNVTVLLPWVAPKFSPVIVIEVPIVPESWLKLVMLGGRMIVKADPLLAVPNTVTTTFPVVAPVGTVTTMLVALQLVTVAVVPLNATLLLPCVAPKFNPVIVTATPTAPEIWLRLVMLGGGTTVKVEALVGCVPYVPTTLPVVAPVGTATVTLVALQALGVAAVPLNVTVLVPCVAPKSASSYGDGYADRPRGLALKLLMEVATVKGDPLLARPPTVTTTLPVVAPAGTVTTMLALLQLVTVAAVLLNANGARQLVLPSKPVPVMVIDAPTAPEV